MILGLHVVPEIITVYCFGFGGVFVVFFVGVFCLTTISVFLNLGLLVGVDTSVVTKPKEYYYVSLAAESLIWMIAGVKCK